MRFFLTFLQGSLNPQNYELASQIPVNNYQCSDSLTILGLWILGLTVSHINESQLQTYESRTLFLMTSLQYYCILGLAEIKTLHPRDKIMRKRCKMRR